jgi:hypothetical protein
LRLVSSSTLTKAFFVQIAKNNSIRPRAALN